MSAARWLSIGALWLCACSLQSANKGDTCTRSSQCAPGLVCVQGKCGTDLTSIGKQSQVPTVQAGAAGAVAADDAG